MTVDMMIKDATYEAKVKAKAEGRAEGKAEGKAEGLAEGASNEKRAATLRMLEAGMTIEAIQIATNLSEEEILALQKDNS